ncbi:MAG: hypothetical protein ACLR8P_09925 [Clostridium fessum]
MRTFPGVAETAVKAVHEHGRDYLKSVDCVGEKKLKGKKLPEVTAENVVAPIWQFGNFWQEDWQIMRFHANLSF